MALAALKTSIITRFANFLRSAQGNTTIIATIAAIPMIGSVGLAVDYMRGVRASEALQHVADAAALAAASAKNVTGTQSEQMNQRATIAANYLNDSVGNVSDIEVIGAPTVATGPNSIKITVDAKVKGSFINVLNALKDGSADLGGGSLGNQAGQNSKDINLHVSSTVGFSEDAYLCLLAMNPTQTEAIYFQGNSKFMATCSVHANSNATTAIRTWGNAAAYAASFTTRGGWAGSGGTAYVVYEVDGLPDHSRDHAAAYGYQPGFTASFVDTALAQGGLLLDGSDFVDLELTTVGISSITTATLAVYGRSYNTTASGSFTWQTFDGLGAAPTNLVSNVAPYAWYAADMTTEISPGDGNVLIRIKAGPSSGTLAVNRIELCMQAD